MVDNEAMAPEAPNVPEEWLQLLSVCARPSLSPSVHAPRPRCAMPACASRKPESCELQARIGAALERIYGAYTISANTAVLGPEAVQPPTFVGAAHRGAVAVQPCGHAAARPRRGAGNVGTNAVLRGTTTGADRRSRTLPSAVCAAASTRFVPARINHPFSALPKLFYRSDAAVSDRQSVWSAGGDFPAAPGRPSVMPSLGLKRVMSPAG